jgi:ubiquinone/menaquinone biosynthesis C-methylase UbiE
MAEQAVEDKAAPEGVGVEAELGLDFLVVDEFLKTLVDARALKTAFELGLIDRLITHRSGSVEALGRMLGLDPAGGRFLFDLLAANRVTEAHGQDLRLTRRFLTALRYRDLLETRLDYAGFTITDFADLFTTLVRNAAGFMGQASLFALFDYRRCFDFTPENYALTRGWMRITSTLTKYESRAAMRLHDFTPHRRMLDIGGNSGEFALRLCRRHPALHATILDLPLVCEIGTEHVLAEPERARITYLPTDLRRDPIPAGFDLITFKSMLHDWPEAEAGQFLDKAARALERGGTLLIFERAPLSVRDGVPPLSMLPNLLFFRSYRPAAAYETWLRSLGLENVRSRSIGLDSEWYVVTGRKP